MPTQASPKSILALDVGAKRVGIAVASLSARLPRPLVTLEWGEKFFDELKEIVNTEGVIALVVGFPRGLEGQHTGQTEAVEVFARQLRQYFELPIHMQDEALTSKHAEEELEARGKSYNKAAVDSLAATYILEDYLSDNPEAEA